MNVMSTTATARREWVDSPLIGGNVDRGARARCVNGVIGMRIPYRQKVLTTFAVVAALALAVPAAASAQELGTSSSPTAAQYGDQSQEFSSGGSNTPPTSTDPSSSRAIASLPFTGADLIVLASGAVVLLGAGLLLRRQARARS